MINRRTLLKGLGVSALSHTSLLRGLGTMSAFAQDAGSSSDYKALVCIFLYGGNDSNNMLVPLDNSSYQLYTKNRGPLGLGQQALLPLGNSRFAVHPAMPNVQKSFGNGSLAFVANVGSLRAPTTQAQIEAGTAVLPSNLESHSDQVTEVQTGLATTDLAQGWGGRIADVLNSSYQGVLPMCTSVGANNAFINGADTIGLITPGVNGQLFCSIGNACANRVAGNAGLIALSEGNPLVAADQQLVSRVLKQNQLYSSIVGQAPPIKTVFPAGFAQQFIPVIKQIQMRQALSANRQVFYLNFGSFDTHATQLDAHTSLLSALDGALQAFAAALEEIGMASNVTTFTLSDFNRTLTANGSGGSDHAWGGHQLIMGGAVKGGTVYGTFPTLDPYGPDDQGDHVGRWIPTTSVSQMGGSLASWFGVPQTQLSTVFPYLSQFAGPLPSYF